MSDKSPDAAVILAWAEQIEAVLAAHPPVPEDLPDDPLEAVEVFNQMLARGIAVAAVHERFGFSPTVDEFKADALRAWKTRKLSKGEFLCIAVAAFYAEKFRLPAAGPKDTPMQAAMAAAKLSIDAVASVSDPSDKMSLVSALRLEAAKMADKDDGHEAAYEAARKSIRRFRNSINGRPVFWLNPETFQIEVMSGFDRLHGLKGKRGRPPHS